MGHAAGLLLLLLTLDRAGNLHRGRISLRSEGAKRKREKKKNVRLLPPTFCIPFAPLGLEKEETRFSKSSRFVSIKPDDSLVNGDGILVVFARQSSAAR